MIRPEPEILKKIADYELEAQPWIEDNYESVVRLIRAHIKGLRYALGEDYDVKTGDVNKMAMRTEQEIREYIANLEEESKEYIAYDAVIRQFRAIIKGAKWALGENYSITDGK